MGSRHDLIFAASFLHEFVTTVVILVNVMTLDPVPRDLVNFRKVQEFNSHNGMPNTVEALPEIIEGLHAKGYTFVRLRDLWDHGMI